MSSYTGLEGQAPSVLYRRQRLSHTLCVMLRRYLEGQAPLYRQTVILSSFPSPQVSALFHRACVNHEGKAKVRCTYPGVLPHVTVPVRQIFERVPSQSIADSADARFDHFVKHVYPRLRDSLQGGILVFIRSYFEFVRVRNFLRSQDASFCLLGEYTKASDISRSRSWFFHGKRKILLYTERAHFYHRYALRGTREVLFYSLPEHPGYYPEILQQLQGVSACSSTALFSAFDNLQLERIVGTARCKRMTQSPNSTFMFC